MAQEALQPSDAFHWSQQTRPPFQTFLTKKTSRLSIDVRLDGCGISSPANDLPVSVSILACCGYTAPLWYLPVSTTVPTRSHVSPSLPGVPISLPCQISLRSGEGFISRLYAHLAKQVSHSRSNLSDATRPPVRPVAIAIVLSASAS